MPKCFILYIYLTYLFSYNVLLLMNKKSHESNQTITKRLLWGKVMTGHHLGICDFDTKIDKNCRVEKS